MNISLKKILTVYIAFILVFLFSACSVNENVKPHAPEPTATQTGELRDNSITIGIVELDTYNPLTTNSVTMKNMLGFIFEPLFAVDEKQKSVGVLAESYELSPDGKSIIIKLKSNVIWHDGGLFSANDVVYTIKAIMNNETNFGHLTENIVSVSAMDSQTVFVGFRRSVPEPAMLMTFPVIKSGSFSADFRATGTGPFYLDYDRLSRFDAYYGEKAKIDCVIVKSVPDNDKFVSLFNASVIDIADSDMLNMTEYTPRANASVCNYITNEMIFIGFNSNDAVFKYPEARKSIYEITDRQEIVSHVYFSRAKEAHYPVNPDNRFYPEKSENMHSDRGTAEKLLKDGGWEKDKRGVYFHSEGKGATYFSVEILVNSDDKERMKIASQISDTMSELGMRNTIYTCSESEFKTRISNGDYDMFIGKTVLPPNNDLTDFLFTNAVSGYKDEETEILFSQLGTLISDEDKEKVYEQIFENLTEDCPMAPICFLKGSLVTSAKLKSGVCPSVSGTVVRTENWSVK